MLPRNAPCYDIHVRLRLSDRHTVLQAANYQQPVEIVIDLLGLESERHHKLRFQTVGLAGQVYAHHRVRLSIHFDLFADDLSIRAELLPKPVREDDDVVLAHTTFVGQKITPEEESCSHHAVCAGCHFAPDNAFWLVTGCEVVGDIVPCD